MSWATNLFAGFRYVPRTLGMVWRSSPRSTIALGVLTVVVATIPLGIAWAGKAIVDAVVAHSQADVVRWVIIELILVAALALGNRALGVVRQLLGAQLSIDIHLSILDKARNLHLEHFEDAEFYDQLTRARREASSRPMSVLTETFQLGQHLITLVGYVGLLVGFSPLAVLALLIAATPAAISEIKFSNSAFRIRNWRSPDTRKLGYVEFLLSNDRHAKEIKMFGLGDMLIERYRELSHRFYNEDRTLTLQRAGWAAILSLIATITFYGCYAWMAVVAVEGKLTLGDLVLYVAAFRQGQQAFQNILNGLGGMYEHNLYMSNLFAFFDIDTRMDAAAHRAENAAVDAGQEGGSPASSERASAPDPTERGIRFDAVSYRYPGQEDDAIHGLNLFIPEGERVALVGKNGAGKTTLIKLLSRLYEPSAGRILLDGRDLSEWSPEALRARMSVLFQDFNQYQLSVEENVGFGSLGRLGDREALDEASQRAGADALIASMADGWDTQLGRWFKKGTELSGGQWQKLALARAFIRNEADILILDEPTAALDAEAEHALFERFFRLTKGRTSILISHRFPTVRMADRIILLEQGSIVEQGSHQQLVEQQGKYARMYSLQAASYLDGPSTTD